VVSKKSKKILIVDDDSSVRYNLRKVLNEFDLDIYTAKDGEKGLKEYEERNPEIILIDWLMPKLNGIELIEKIRDNNERKPAIIFLTAVSSQSAKMMALKSGADFYLTKPVNKLKLSKIINKIIRNPNYYKSFTLDKNKLAETSIPFVAVGVAASTGGPPTIKYLFKELGNIDNAAFFITQHGPEWMLKASVEFLQRETKMKVFLGKEDLKILPGQIYIAPGNRHLAIGKDLKIHLLDTPPENFVKPSADPMFKSISEVFGSKAIGVVLTGMGSDGSIGCGYISAGGGKIIVEDPSTAILHAMPSSVIKLKLADTIVPIDKMSFEIIDTINDILKI